LQKAITQGVSTSKPPSSSDIWQDSVLHSGGGIYQTMKINMERTLAREQERLVRRQTLNQISKPDESAKGKQSLDNKRRNNSEMAFDSERKKITDA